MDQRVAVARTTPSVFDFASALLREWRAVVGTLPTKEQAGVLWAHFAGETADGKYCWNWNLGNWKHTPGSGQPYVSLAGVWECFTLRDEDGDGDIDEDDRVMLIARLVRTGAWREDMSADHAKACGPLRVSLIATGDNAMSWFRAYRSLDEGMSAFVERKADQRKDARGNYVNRYAPAWAFVLRGDPDGYARELGRLRYYTASPDAYARAMRAKWHAWMAAPGFDQALGELLAVSEAETQPELPDAPDPESTRVVDWDIVRGRVPLGRPSLDDLDDPGEEPVS